MLVQIPSKFASRVSKEILAPRKFGVVAESEASLEYPLQFWCEREASERC